MNTDRANARVGWGLSGGFLLLALLFYLDLWGKVAPVPTHPLVDPKFTLPGTVRLSAWDIKRMDDDFSPFECYLCHEEGESPELEFDEMGRILLAEDHQDLGLIRHGEHDRNNHCYNCHNRERLDKLETRDHRLLNIEDSSPLCGSCHGPTYRDWEAGIHGRAYGFWDETQGERERVQCASCHNPHAPAFPSIEPAPAPFTLHE